MKFQPFLYGPDGQLLAGLAAELDTPEDVERFMRGCPTRGELLVIFQKLRDLCRADTNSRVDKLEKKLRSEFTIVLGDLVDEAPKREQDPWTVKAARFDLDEEAPPF